MLIFSRSATSINREVEKSKLHARNQIDTRAGEIRTGYITVIPGQEMTYQEKERQAGEYLSIDPRPDDIGYPALTEEIGVTGATTEEVAQTIMTQAAAWRVIGPKIEGLRLKGKKAITESATLDEINQHLANYLEDLGDLENV